MSIRHPGRGGRGTLLTWSVPLALALAGCAGEVAVQDPELLTLDPPFQYPVALWDEGVEGETLLMVRVTEMGAVDSVFVLESSGHPAFDSAAVNGAAELRFSPGRRDDRRVVSWAKLPVRFNLEPVAPEAGPGEAAGDTP